MNPENGPRPNTVDKLMDGAAAGCKGFSTECVGAERHPGREAQSDPGLAGNRQAASRPGWRNADQPMSPHSLMRLPGMAPQ